MRCRPKPAARWSTNLRFGGAATSAGERPRTGEGNLMATTTPAQGTTANDGRIFTILAFVFGVVAILFIPVLFGIAAIVLAVIGMRKGDPLARWALGVAIVGTVLGFALGAAVMSSSDDALQQVGR